MEATLQFILDELKTMNHRMDSMEHHMDTMESHIGSMENRMDSIESHMDSMECHMDSMDSRIGSVENHLSNLTDQVKENTMFIQALVNGQHKIEQKLDNAMDFMQNLAVRTTTLEHVTGKILYNLADDRR